MFEVPYGQDPYSAIGRYIRENITAIEDMIAVIEVNGVETNELFMVDMEEDGFFVWKSDWYEGEKNVALIDFFPVSEAINSSAQPERPTGEWLRMSDLSEKDDNRYKCSRCGNVIHHKSRMDLYTFNSWCGRCGSDNSRHTT